MRSSLVNEGNWWLLSGAEKATGRPNIPALVLDPSVYTASGPNSYFSASFSALSSLFFFSSSLFSSSPPLIGGGRTTSPGKVKPWLWVGASAALLSAGMSPTDPRSLVAKGVLSLGYLAVSAARGRA